MSLTDDQNNDESQASLSKQVIVDDQYTNQGRPLMKDRVFKTFNYHSTLPAHKAEDFAKQFGKIVERFRKE